MTVRPPEFDELVRLADFVIRGEITAVRSEWRGADASRRIVTLVTVSVQRRLVSDAPATIELEFLGGQVGADEMAVPGQPQFRRGDREFLFVRGNGRQISPLVHAMFGRYRIVERESGRPPEVLRDDGLPLASIEDVSLPLANPAMAERLRPMKRRALTADEFEALIVHRAREVGRVAPQ